MPRVSLQRKQSWFDLGAKSFSTIRPDESQVPVYPCPICLTLFTADAMTDGRLTAEDVPLRSLGGRPLLLTCKKCNNEAGASIDADAKGSEDVREVLAGRRAASVKATIGGVPVNAELDLGKGQLAVYPRRNLPGTRQKLQEVRVGVQGTYLLRQPSELGRNISWLKAGYLTLVGEYGFKIAFDPAMAIVRDQIMQSDERKMATFLTELSFDVDVNVRRICRLLTPSDLNGWGVQVGRFIMFYPLKDNMTFYDRLARYAGTSPNTTMKIMSIPSRAVFGFDEVLSASNDGTSSEGPAEVSVGTDISIFGNR